MKCQPYPGDACIEGGGVVARRLRLFRLLRKSGKEDVDAFPEAEVVARLVRSHDGEVPVARDWTIVHFISLT